MRILNHLFSVGLAALGLGWGFSTPVLAQAPAAPPTEAKAPAESAPAKKAAPPKKVDPAMQPVDDVPGLPRVLLIGDSISIGYTVAVRELMQGKANVHRPLTNCGPTSNGVSNLEKWLGDKPWDVIHFNWGLHDLKYMTPDGTIAVPGGENVRQQISLGDYEKNLRALVAKLKKTKATLVWCSTTPVPEGAKGRFVDDAPKYNAIAAKVMAEEKIATDDLFKFASDRQKEIQLPKDVHFTAAGSKILAEEVVRSIEAALKSRKKE